MSSSRRISTGTKRRAEDDGDEEPTKRVRSVVDQDECIMDVDAAEPDFSHDNENPDMRVTCQGRSWNVHRTVLCSNRAFFENGCSGAFSKIEDRTISMDHDDPDAVHVLLEYLYGIRLRLHDEECWNASSSSSSRDYLELLLSVLRVAERYNQPPLTEAVDASFSRARTSSCRWSGARLVEVLDATYDLSHPSQAEDFRVSVADAFVSAHTGDVAEATSRIFERKPQVAWDIIRVSTRKWATGDDDDDNDADDVDDAEAMDAS